MKLTDFEMSAEFSWDETLVPVVDAASLAIEGIPDALRDQWQKRPADILFLAWRKAFLDDWAKYEKQMDPKIVALARKLAGGGSDHLVFTQPLAACTTKTGQTFKIRDMIYNTAPFWFAAYYDVAMAALADEAAPSAS